MRIIVTKAIHLAKIIYNIAYNVLTDLVGFAIVLTVISTVITTSLLSPTKITILSVVILFIVWLIIVVVAIFFFGRFGSNEGVIYPMVILHCLIYLFVLNNFRDVVECSKNTLESCSCSDCRLFVWFNGSWFYNFLVSLS